MGPAVLQIKGATGLFATLGRILGALLVICSMCTVCSLRSWMYAWVFLLIGGVDPLFLDPSDGVFGRFDLAALCGCRPLHFCLFVCLFIVHYLTQGVPAFHVVVMPV